MQYEAIEEEEDLLVLDERRLPHRGQPMARLNPHTRNVLQLGVGFFFVFSAFNSQGFIEESVLNSYAARGIVRPHDGYTSLAIIYASFTVLNFAAAPIVARLGARLSLAGGALAYALFLAGFLFLNRWYLFATSALLGLGAAVIWTAQGQYLTLNSSERTAGKHSSLFWALSQTCQSCGGLFLLGVFLLSNEQTSAFSEATVRLLYTAFLGLTLLGTCVLALLPMPPSNSSSAEAPHRAAAADSPLHSVDFAEEEGPAQPPMVQQPSHWEILQSTLRLALTRRMALFSAAFMYTGLAQSFWSSVYPTSIANTELFHLNQGVNPRVMLALVAIVQGLGEIASGFLFGILDGRTRRIGRSRIVAVGAVLQLCAFAGVSLNIPWNACLEKTYELGVLSTPSITVALGCALLLGFGDACWNTQIVAVLISKYPVRSAQAFSLFKFFQSLLTCAAFYYSGFATLVDHSVILGVSCLLGLVAFALVERLGPQPDDDEATAEQDGMD